MAEKCMACRRLLRPGERVMFDVGGEYIHADCCGPERESYVNADAEPLGPNDPIPTGFIWSEDEDPNISATNAELIEQALSHPPLTSDTTPQGAEPREDGVKRPPVTLGDQKARHGVVFSPRGQTIWERNAKP